MQKIFSKKTIFLSLFCFSFFALEGSAKAVYPVAGSKRFSLFGFFFAFFLTCTGFALASPAYGADLYVATTGNDNNNGLINTPFKTIQKAANVVNPGDTVYVRGGTYNERVTLTTSGTSGNYITFQNYPSEIPTISYSGPVNIINGPSMSYYKIIGFKITNYNTSGAGAGQGIAFHGTLSHIEIRDNEISYGNQNGGYGHAIYVQALHWPGPTLGTITDVIIDNNYIHDTNTGPAEAYDEALTIAGNVQRFQITNNTVYNTTRIGIDVIGRTNSGIAKYGIISGNIVNNVGSLGNEASIYVDGAQYVTIENNTVYDGAGPGIFTGNEDDAHDVINIIVRKNKVWNNFRNISIGGGYTGTSLNARVVHNTAVTTVSGKQSNYYLGKGTGHIAKNNIGYFSSSGTFYMLENAWQITVSPTLDYNNYYPSSATGMYYWYEGAYSIFSEYITAKSQDTHSITTNPQFTNLGGNDFTLQSGSNAIDKGDFLTRTTSAGSGTVITVSDARYFHNGYGISGVSGDTIRVGSNTVTIIGINYSTNTLTVTPSISWNNGDGVSYDYSGSKPDMGAYESGSAGDTTPPASPSGLSVN